MKKKVQKPQFSDINKGMENRRMKKMLIILISRRHYKLFETGVYMKNYIGDRRLKEYRKLKRNFQNNQFASKLFLKDLFDLAFENNKDNYKFLSDGKSYHSTVMLSEENEVLTKEINAVKQALEEIKMRDMKKILNAAARKARKK